jgi:riboflavin biosynthesis pyrimidine reductase
VDTTDPEALAGLYAYPADQWLRANMVASADGAATLGGVTQGLSSEADREVFALLRALADVVVVGAGTARAENYGPARVRQAWRGLRADRPPTPPIAVITARLDLDPGSRLIAEAPPHARTIVITTAQAPAGRRAELARHCDVVVAGDTTVDLKAAMAVLADRGHQRMLAEGGPHLLAQLMEAGVLDELCLTIGPLMAGPGPPRIVTGALHASEPMAMTLEHVLEDNGFLLCRYTRKNPLSRTSRGASSPRAAPRPTRPSGLWRLAPAPARRLPPRRCGPTRRVMRSPRGHGAAPGRPGRRR